MTLKDKVVYCIVCNSAWISDRDEYDECPYCHAREKIKILPSYAYIGKPRI